MTSPHFPTRRHIQMVLTICLALACPATSALAQFLAPRLEARGTEFELLGLIEAGGILIYLDDLKTNEPIVGAIFDIDVGTSGRSLTLKEVEPGLYWADAKWLSRPGSHDLIISVTAGNRTDLLGTTVVTPPVTPVMTNLWAEWKARGGLLLAFVGGVFATLLLRMLARFWRWMRRRSPAALASSGDAPNRATTAAALLIALVGASVSPASVSPASAMPSGPGHNHGPDGVTTDVAADNQPADSPRRLADGSLFIPKAAQRVLAIRTIAVASSEIARTTRVFGRIIADPTASGRIQAGIQGRIDAGDGGLFVVGQHVTRGQVVCTVVPIVNPVDNANIQQQVSQIDAELRLLSETADQAAAGTIPSLSQRDLQTIKLDLMSLQQRKDGISLVMNDRDTLRIPLRSPATGVIAISNVLAGQIVEAKDILFEVIDPNRIWVEAAAFDMDVVNNIAGAKAITDNGKTYTLSFIGRAPRLRQQAIPLNFRIDKPDAGLIVGSPVNVFIQGRTSQTAVLVPQQAITTTASGQAIVFEHVTAERFVPILIRSEIIDGSNVAVLAGLPPGKRIVVDGAGLLGQIR